MEVSYVLALDDRPAKEVATSRWGYLPNDSVKNRRRLGGMSTTQEQRLGYKSEEVLKKKRGGGHARTERQQQQQRVTTSNTTTVRPKTSLPCSSTQCGQQAFVLSSLPSPRTFATLQATMDVLQKEKETVFMKQETEGRPNTREQVKRPVTRPKRGEPMAVLQHNAAITSGGQVSCKLFRPVLRVAPSLLHPHSNINNNVNDNNKDNHATENENTRNSKNYGLRLEEDDPPPSTLMAEGGVAAGVEAGVSMPAHEIRTTSPSLLASLSRPVSPTCSRFFMHGQREGSARLQQQQRNNNGLQSTPASSSSFYTTAVPTVVPSLDLLSSSSSSSSRMPSSSSIDDFAWYPPISTIMSVPAVVAREGEREGEGGGISPLPVFSSASLSSSSSFFSSSCSLPMRAINRGLITGGGGGGSERALGLTSGFEYQRTNRTNRTAAATAGGEGGGGGNSSSSFFFPAKRILVENERGKEGVLAVGTNVGKWEMDDRVVDERMGSKLRRRESQREVPGDVALYEPGMRPERRKLVYLVPTHGHTVSKTVLPKLEPTLPVPSSSSSSSSSFPSCSSSSSSSSSAAASFAQSPANLLVACLELPPREPRPMSAPAPPNPFVHNPVYYYYDTTTPPAISPSTAATTTATTTSTTTATIPSFSNPTSPTPLPSSSHPPFSAASFFLSPADSTTSTSSTSFTSVEPTTSTTSLINPSLHAPLPQQQQQRQPVSVVLDTHPLWTRPTEKQRALFLQPQQQRKRYHGKTKGNRGNLSPAASPSAASSSVTSASAAAAAASSVSSVFASSVPRAGGVVNMLELSLVTCNQLSARVQERKKAEAEAAARALVLQAEAEQRKLKEEEENCYLLNSKQLALQSGVGMNVQTEASDWAVFAKAQTALRSALPLLSEHRGKKGERLDMVVSGLTISEDGMKDGRTQDGNGEEGKEKGGEDEKPEAAKKEKKKKKREEWSEHALPNLHASASCADSSSTHSSSSHPLTNTSGEGGEGRGRQGGGGGKGWSLLKKKLVHLKMAEIALLVEKEHTRERRVFVWRRLKEEADKWWQLQRLMNDNESYEEDSQPEEEEEAEKKEEAAEKEEEQQQLENEQPVPEVQEREEAEDEVEENNATETELESESLEKGGAIEVEEQEDNLLASEINAYTEHWQALVSQLGSSSDVDDKDNGDNIEDLLNFQIEN